MGTRTQLQAVGYALHMSALISNGPVAGLHAHLAGWLAGSLNG